MRLSIAIFFCVASTCFAQGTHTFDGDSASDEFGRSVSSAGDVNGDGYDDIIVGAYLDDNNGLGSGSARIFMGSPSGTFTTFVTLNGDNANDQFGRSVSGAGDVNGDGYDDVIVGARLDDNNGFRSGSARIFMGSSSGTFNTFVTLNGDSADEWFGQSVSDAGDVNGDGYDDIIVGAFWDDNNGLNSGSARIFMGSPSGTFTTFVTLNGDNSEDSFGFSVSSAGDVNGDGYDDIIVGAPGDDNNGLSSGSARVLLGGPSTLFTTSVTLNGDSAGDNFGSSVGGAGDVNRDGYDDIIVGLL